ncbi:MAG: DUF5666 domain-containing protein [Rhodopila sp.]|nr:DUF5666 domain-containing protein [Rhodopila sp.]
MKRLAALLMLCLLAACVGPVLDPGDDDQTVFRSNTLAGGVVCRAGRNGGPVVADRGIGGTGAPMAVPGLSRVGDRGIGGTGVVGVITGFASVCVNGLEVRYDRSAAVDINGTPASASALRAGQMVVIQAEGAAKASYARTISVRHEVAGRIESVQLRSGMLTIGGQPVSVPEGTWGANHFRLGDWVEVSGLRREDGIIVASRLDRAPAGLLTARGRVVRDRGVTRLGDLVLSGTAADVVKPGQFVTVSGRYVADKGQVDRVEPDTLFSDPAGYFGPSVNRLAVEAFVRVTNGAVWMNGLKVSTAPGVRGHAGPGRIAVVSLERRRDGSYIAVGLRYTDFRGGANRTSRGAGGRAQGDLSSSRTKRAPATEATPADDAGGGSATDEQTESGDVDPASTHESLSPGEATPTPSPSLEGRPSAPGQTPPSPAPVISGRESTWTVASAAGS